jgi:D-sedoheptulose 7-phosphate isomerase
MSQAADGTSSVEQSRAIAERVTSGHALLIVGLGPDAALAQGACARLAGTRVVVRSLLADAATVTAIANDFGFDQVYARQVAALAREGDVLLIVSSGPPHRSLAEAARAAAAAGASVATVSGGTRVAGRDMRPHLDDVVAAIIDRDVSAG